MLMYTLLQFTTNYSDMKGSLKFYSKDETTNIDVDIANTDTFKYFKNKSKLLGNTDAHGVNGILRNRAIAVRLKYLGNVWRSLEMPLINWEVELKRECTNHYVLAVSSADNDNANHLFTIQDTKLNVNNIKQQSNNIKTS